MGGTLNSDNAYQAGYNAGYAIGAKNVVVTNTLPTIVKYVLTGYGCGDRRDTYATGTIYTLNINDGSWVAQQSIRTASCYDTGNSTWTSASQSGSLTFGSHMVTYTATAYYNHDHKYDVYSTGTVSIDGVAAWNGTVSGYMSANGSYEQSSTEKIFVLN